MTRAEDDLIRRCTNIYTLINTYPWNSLEPLRVAIENKTLSRKEADVLDQFLWDYIEKKCKIITQKRSEFGEWPVSPARLTHQIDSAVTKLVKVTNAFKDDVAKFQNATCKFVVDDYKKAHDFMMRFVVICTSEFCDSSRGSAWNADWITQLEGLRAKWSYAYHRSVQVVLQRMPTTDKNDVDEIIKKIDPEITFLLGETFGNTAAVYDMLHDGYEPLRDHLLLKILGIISSHIPNDLKNGKQELLRMIYRIGQGLFSLAGLAMLKQNGGGQVQIQWISQPVNKVTFGDPTFVHIRNNNEVQREVINIEDDDTRKGRKGVKKRDPTIEYPVVNLSEDEDEEVRNVTDGQGVRIDEE